MASEPVTPEAYEKLSLENEKKRGCCTPRGLGTTSIVVGAIVLVLGVVFGSAMPSVITSKINNGVAICKSEDVNKVSYTDSYGDCDDCTPYYYRLNMFNVTNAEDYLNNGAKLKVQEVGPYGYRRRQIKVDVKVENGGETVSFKQYTYHTFDQSLSCPTCSDQDKVLSWDVAYLNIMSQSGGEKGFLRKLVAGTIWGASLNAAEIDAVIAKDGVKIMRWANGLNSNEPKAMVAVGQSVMLFLASGVQALADIDVTGFEFNGLFVRRTISEWALGYPSLLAGLGLGTNYNKVCSATGNNLEAKCASCTGKECFDLYSECKRCDLGKKVTNINSVTCPLLGKKVEAVYGKAAGDKFVENTCGTYCAQIGICVAPIPGIVESSGLDWSKEAPPSASLGTYIQKTGCKDKNVIGEYIQYDGYKTQPIWAKIDKRRNPTLAEMSAFAIYGNCANPTANMTCSDVIGSDGTSVKPAGASINGFPHKVTIGQNMMYLSQSKQNVTLFNTGKVYKDIDGIELTRFVPPTNLLNWKPETDKMGTGYPVDGVQPLAFSVGFPAYLSFPMFLYGDKSLTEGVDITMFDGVKASEENMLVNGELKPEYYNRYQTYIDMEPGTGKAMRARKRLMASYALAESQFTPGKPISDLVYPKLKYDVISPAYIGEELATIQQNKILTYKGVKGILSALIPVLVVSIILGLVLIGGGFIYRKRSLRNIAKGPSGDLA